MNNLRKQRILEKLAYDRHTRNLVTPLGPANITKSEDVWATEGLKPHIQRAVNRPSIAAFGGIQGGKEVRKRYEKKTRPVKDRLIAHVREDLAREKDLGGYHDPSRKMSVPIKQTTTAKTDINRIKTLTKDIKSLKGKKAK